MTNAPAPFRGVIRGRIIELEEAPALPEGQKVSVQLLPVEEPPKWLDVFTVDPSMAPGKLLVKGTRLLAEELAKELDAGRSDQELLVAHPELTQKHVDALRQYVRVPAIQRRLFGSWAEDAKELDHFLEEIRRLRKQPRRTVDG
jgi:uncharacterized protein (DUF433 family)